MLYITQAAAALKPKQADLVPHGKVRIKKPNIKLQRHDNVKPLYLNRLNATLHFFALLSPTSVAFLIAVRI